jgi:hypothetical protein
MLIVFLGLVIGMGLILFVSQDASSYANDPTLVATKPTDLVVPNTGSSVQRRLYETYYQFFPPRRGHFSFRGSPAPMRCSIHGLLNQCQDVSRAQFFVDKQVASGSVMFGPTNTLSGPQWVTAFTNAVQTGEVEWYDVNENRFRKDNPVFIALGKNSYLVLPKDRLEKYGKQK